MKMDCTYQGVFIDHVPRLPSGMFYCTIASRKTERRIDDQVLDYPRCNCVKEKECMYVYYKSNMKKLEAIA